MEVGATTCGFFLVAHAMVMMVMLVTVVVMVVMVMILTKVGATTSGVFLVAYVLAMEMVGPQYRFHSIMTLSVLKLSL